MYVDKDGYLWSVKRIYKGSIYLYRKYGNMHCIYVCKINDLAKWMNKL